jgi:hypothetical protein
VRLEPINEKWKLTTYNINITTFMKTENYFKKTANAKKHLVMSN